MQTYAIRRMAWLCVTILMCSVAGMADDIEIRIRDSAGFPGSEASVAVTWSGSANPSAIAFWIEFDSSKVTFVDAEPGLILAAANKDLSWDIPQPGRVSFVIFGGNAFLLPGKLMTLKFDIDESVASGETIELHGLNESATDSGADPLTTEIEDGWIDVLDCFDPANPQNLNATDGLFGDRIQLTWTPVFGAQSYVVYRNSANDVSGAQVVAVTILPFYSDFAVQGPVSASGGSGGCSGGGSATTSYTTYYYWVQAKNICGQSGLTASEPGYRGKSADAKAVLVTPTALPTVADETTSTFYVRLTADEAIEPDSVHAVVEGGSAAAIDWIADGETAAMGWVAVTLEAPAAPGTVVSIETWAGTVSGQPVEPVAHSFGIGVVRKAGSGALDFAATAVPDFVQSVGPVFEVSPQAPFDAPQRVTIPVPDGVDADDVMPHLYVDESGWYPAVVVDGWLVPDSLRVDDGGASVSFAVNHGGLVQLGIAPARLAAAGTTSLGGLLTVVAPLAILGAASGLRRRKLPNS